jgi:hypothetical protein
MAQETEATGGRQYAVRLATSHKILTLRFSQEFVACLLILALISEKIYPIFSG